ncbi:hypothetical protein DFJ73DRAFT_764553 [Zopfochytrium polystomum]|nr:hypothetical protein DFJ73DRAFT_764553 [Zopfochytrium polystomum]
MVVLWKRIQKKTSYSEGFTEAFTEQMATLIDGKSAAIEIWKVFCVKILNNVAGHFIPMAREFSLACNKPPNLTFNHQNWILIVQMLDPGSGLMISHNVASCLKQSVLERDETWFEEVAFGKRVKILYKKYGSL